MERQLLTNRFVDLGADFQMEKRACYETEINEICISDTTK